MTRLANVNSTKSALSLRVPFAPCGACGFEDAADEEEEEEEEEEPEESPTKGAVSPAPAPMSSVLPSASESCVLGESSKKDDGEGERREDISGSMVFVDVRSVVW